MAEQSLKDSFLKKLNQIDEQEEQTAEDSKESEEECVDCEEPLSEEEEGEVNFMNALLEEVEKRAGRTLTDTEIDEIIDAVYTEEE